jgi:hypothetical protein
MGEDQPGHGINHQTWLTPKTLNLPKNRTLPSHPLDLSMIVKHTPTRTRTQSHQSGNRNERHTAGNDKHPHYEPHRPHQGYLQLRASTTNREQTRLRDVQEDHTNPDETWPWTLLQTRNNDPRAFPFRARGDPASFLPCTTQSTPTTPSETEAEFNEPRRTNGEDRHRKLTTPSGTEAEFNGPRRTSREDRNRKLTTLDQHHGLEQPILTPLNIRRAKPRSGLPSPDTPSKLRMCQANPLG